ncbi:hypothetical protein [Alicyclobacillus sendaiensis]|uniref:hypothetical protein n=1 Tax=Alicyclobacillus sendaiensis TaxID=192387 RepID=UPI0026F45644|nr:hypothetical protein [Alicyclobacillus sendaiensis]
MEAVSMGGGHISTHPNYHGNTNTGYVDSAAKVGYELGGSLLAAKGAEIADIGAEAMSTGVGFVPGAIVTAFGLAMMGFGIWVMAR